MTKNPSAEIVSNRRAFFDYHVLESFEAGISLTGTEVKSLRENGGSLQDSYIIIEDGEAFLKNASISPYHFGNIHNHEEKRLRKLLLHKYEIRKLKALLQEKGLTLIPLSLYFKKGIVKVKIASCKGKKTYDKRDALKEKEEKRSVQRALKGDY